MYYSIICCAICSDFGFCLKLHATTSMTSFSLRSGSKELLWPTTACVVGILVLLPILAVFYLSLFPEENIWPHLFSTVLPAYINNTLILMLGVGVSSTLLGVGAAWLISSCDFAGRKIMNWALLLPSRYQPTLSPTSIPICSSMQARYNNLFES